MQEYIEVKSNGKIIAKKGTNPRSPYNHQKDAMAKLSLIDKEESFSTLVVLPTGGGINLYSFYMVIKECN